MKAIEEEFRCSNTRSSVMTAAKEKEDKLGRYLSFSLGKEEYAIPLLKVKEVIAVPDTTPVPFTPAHFLGMMNLRGQVISVVDLRLKLGMKKVDRTEETAVIIIDLDPIFLGIVVDSVNKVLNLTEGEISNPPELLDKKNGDY